MSHITNHWPNWLIVVVVEKEGRCGLLANLRIIVNKIEKVVILIGVSLRLLRLLDVLEERTYSTTCAATQACCIKWVIHGVSIGSRLLEYPM